MNCNTCNSENVEHKEHLTFDYWFCHECKDEVGVCGVDFPLGEPEAIPLVSNGVDPADVVKQVHKLMNAPTLAKSAFPMNNLPNQLLTVNDYTDFITNFFGKSNVGNCFVGMGNGEVDHEVNLLPDAPEITRDVVDKFLEYVRIRQPLSQAIAVNSWGPDLLLFKVW